MHPKLVVAYAWLKLYQQIEGDTMKETKLRETVINLADAIDASEGFDDLTIVIEALEPFFVRWAELPELQGLRTAESKKLRADIRGLAFAMYNEGRNRANESPEARTERYAEQRRDDRTIYDVFSQAFGYQSSGGFTKADAAAQPKNLTALESCIRAAIFDVIDKGEECDPGEWMFYDSRFHSEAEANEERTKFADAVVVRLRKMESRPTVRECPGCAAAHADQVDPVKAHLAAAEAWDKVEWASGYGYKHSNMLSNAQEATARASESTKAAESNPKAFDHTTAALLAASMVMPAEAAAAHRRAAAAYREMEDGMSPAQIELLKVLPPDAAQYILESRMEHDVDIALEGLIAKRIILVDKTSVDR